MFTGTIWVWIHCDGPSDFASKNKKKLSVPWNYGNPTVWNPLTMCSIQLLGQTSFHKIWKCSCLCSVSTSLIAHYRQGCIYECTDCQNRTPINLDALCPQFSLSIWKEPLKQVAHFLPGERADTLLSFRKNHEKHHTHTIVFSWTVREWSC